MAATLSGVSHACMHPLFRKWKAWLREHVATQHTYLPKCEHLLRVIISVYEKMGFPGSVCSIDGAHDAMWAVDKVEMGAHGRERAEGCLYW